MNKKLLFIHENFSRLIIVNVIANTGYAVGNKRPVISRGDNPHDHRPSGDNLVGNERSVVNSGLAGNEQFVANHNLVDNCCFSSKV